MFALSKSLMHKYVCGSGTACLHSAAYHDVIIHNYMKKMVFGCPRGFWYRRQWQYDGNIPAASPGGKLGCTPSLSSLISCHLDSLLLNNKSLSVITCACVNRCSSRHQSGLIFMTVFWSESWEISFRTFLCMHYLYCIKIWVYLHTLYKVMIVRLTTTAVWSRYVMPHGFIVREMPRCQNKMLAVDVSCKTRIPFNLYISYKHLNNKCQITFIWHKLTMMSDSEEHSGGMTAEWEDHWSKQHFNICKCENTGYFSMRDHNV